MHALGITLLAIGGPVFAAVVIYYVIDQQRTGILYRAHKRILIPIAVAAWVCFAAGMLTMVAADGELGDFAGLTSSPFFWVMVAVAVAIVVSSVLRLRKGRQR
jgi:hypothetical protein